MISKKTPTWVHFDKRSFPPACSSGGYPLIRQGSRGVYVCILQDALMSLGYSTGGLDGIFGAVTERSVREYQSKNGLQVDGLVGNKTWNKLMNEVVKNSGNE